jgi:glycine dehydrogenase subunit 1
MPFIPHTENDVRRMLDAIGARDIEQLFDEIPRELMIKSLAHVPPGLPELDVTKLLKGLAKKDEAELCFAGAGAYEHHIPAAVWEIATRGEFYSAYTPYQAEASQGTLQLIYEYQTIMTRLAGLDVSNASLYDGATALAEAVLMAVRCQKEPTKRILVPRTINPLYRKVLRSIVTTQKIELIEVDYNRATGTIDAASIAAHPAGSFDALIVPQPNYFGVLEDVNALTDAAHAKGALVIALVNPMSLAVLAAPGRWGSSGADICCGDGQPLGVPMSSGGPYFGFMVCKKEFVRQMPGRIVGRTVDLDGKEGFTLTLQAREQHIRRAKATSNICTNQGLLVTAATIYLALTGPEGLRRVAAGSVHNTADLADSLSQLTGAKLPFSGSRFHEVVVQLNKPAKAVLRALASRKIVGGVALEADYPELGSSLLVCATETKSAQDLETFTQSLREVLAA